MKRLTLYLFRHLIVATLFVTAGLTLVIWLTQSLRLLEIVVDGGAPIYLFLQLMLVTLPTFLSIVLPIGLLAAVLFTYNRLTMDSELVVMRAAGLGPRAATEEVAGQRGALVRDLDSFDGRVAGGPGQVDEAVPCRAVPLPQLGEGAGGDEGGELDTERAVGPQVAGHGGLFRTRTAGAICTVS